MDELSETGCSDVKKYFLEILDSGDDGEEKKRDFLLKNVDWISLEIFLGVLWV